MKFFQFLAGISLTLFLPLVGFAQTDVKAQEILKGVSNKYKSYQSLSSSFKLSLLNKKTGKTENQNGSISLKGNAFHLSMSDQTVISDGKVTWTHLKDANEVQISEAKSDPTALSPATIFTLYEKGFKSKYIGEKNVEGKVVQQIDLVPEDNKKSYFKIQLNIDKSAKNVNKAVIYDKNGNIYTYTITKFTANPALADDLFTFNPKKYPGIEVVDLR